jgi:hypothetical protein
MDGDGLQYMEALELHRTSLFSLVDEPAIGLAGMVEKKKRGTL